MTLTKNKMVSEVGRRTRQKNRDIQVMLETLFEVWSEELARKGRIELEGFLVLEVQQIDRGENTGQLLTGGQLKHAPRIIQRLVVRPSKRLRSVIKSG